MSAARKQRRATAHVRANSTLANLAANLAVYQAWAGPLPKELVESTRKIFEAGGDPDTLAAGIANAIAEYNAKNPS